MDATKDRFCKCCNQQFTPREAKQMFHSRECSIAWWQDERRQAMAMLRQQRAEQAQQEEHQRA
jgi:hypothetical protein